LLGHDGERHRDFASAVDGDQSLTARGESHSSL